MDGAQTCSMTADRTRSLSGESPCRGGGAAAGQPSESQQSDYLVDNEDDAASLGDLVDFFFS